MKMGLKVQLKFGSWNCLNWKKTKTNKYILCLYLYIYNQISAHDVVVVVIVAFLHSNKMSKTINFKLCFFSI